MNLMIRWGFVAHCQQKNADATLGLAALSPPWMELFPCQV